MIVNKSRIAILRGEPTDHTQTADAIAEAAVLIAACVLKTADGCRIDDAIVTARQMLHATRTMDDDAAARENR